MSFVYGILNPLIGSNTARNKNVRLRKGRNDKKEGIAAGFECGDRERPKVVSRTSSADFANSEFDPSRFVKTTEGPVEYTTPVRRPVSRPLPMFHTFNADQASRGVPQLSLSYQENNDYAAINRSPFEIHKTISTYDNGPVAPDFVRNTTRPQAALTPNLIATATSSSAHSAVRTRQQDKNSAICNTSTSSSSGQMPKCPERAIIQPTRNSRHGDYTYTREVLVDGPVGFVQENRMIDMERRLNDLERSPKNIFVPFQVNSPVTQHRTYDIELKSKSEEIENLQTKLRRAHQQLEQESERHRQVETRLKKELEEEKETARTNISSLGTRLQNAEARLVSVSERVSAVSAESLSNSEIFDNAKGSDQTTFSNRLIAQIQDKNNEIQSLQTDLKSAQEKIAFLLQDIETRNEHIENMQRELTLFQTERHGFGESCSSGSTHLADDDARSVATTTTPSSTQNDVGDGLPHETRRYKKSHTTLSVQNNPFTRLILSNSQHCINNAVTPITNGSRHMTKSQSSIQINGKGGATPVAPDLAQRIRGQGEKLLTLRFLSRAIVDLSKKIEDEDFDKPTDLVRMHDLALDSMSESEGELTFPGNAPLPSEDASRKVESNTRKIDTASDELDQAMSSLRNYFKKQVAELHYKYADCSHTCCDFR